VNPSPFAASSDQIEDGIRVIAVSGELDLSTAPELEEPLQQAVSPGDASVLIDLMRCEFIDSTGIAMIVGAWRQLEGNGSGSRVAICSDNEQVRRVLEVTGLELSIPIHGSREEALAALRS
jgi:anti-sigma B factor antagonist